MEKPQEIIQSKLDITWAHINDAKGFLAMATNLLRDSNHRVAIKALNSTIDSVSKAANKLDSYANMAEEQSLLNIMGLN